MTRHSAFRSAAAGAMTICWAASARGDRRSGSRWTSNGCTSRSRARSAGRASWWRRRDGDERKITMTDWLDDLTIAVPRGALFEGTVELLASLGLDTTELRGNDRKLLFEDIGVITMRPSDVPTYVEDGAADLGITGKDVLLEQAARGSDDPAQREVYELLDLGYGRCTMVLASKAGPDPAAEALRRLGVMRVGTQYPRIAERYLEETGRQAEIVEVKGSVELAPLTGMVEAIVDLTATGTTLREHDLIVREEIVECTARLIANPVAHKLRAREIDKLLERLRAA